MESIWTGPCGMFHGFHMDCSMDSIWNSTWIHGFAIEIHWKFHEIHMESIWTLHGLVHEMHHSMCSPYGIHSGYGLTKWLGTQPKNSPYGIHGLGGGIHPVHMESIWNHPGSVKTSHFLCRRRPRCPPITRPSPFLPSPWSLASPTSLERGRGRVRGCVHCRFRWGCRCVHWHHV